MREVRLSNLNFILALFIELIKIIHEDFKLFDSSIISILRYFLEIFDISLIELIDFSL